MPVQGSKINSNIFGTRGNILYVQAFDMQYIIICPFIKPFNLHKHMTLSVSSECALEEYDPPPIVNVDIT